MMVGVAHCVVTMIVPGEQTVNVQEKFVEPLRPEHRAVAQAVYGHGKERGYGSVGEQCDAERHPLMPRKRNVRQGTGHAEEQQVTQRLKPPLQVTAFRQLAQLLSIDWAPVPLDA